MRDQNEAVPTFLIVRLIASGHLADTDVAIPHGRLRWVEWVPPGRATAVRYQDEREGRLLLDLRPPADEQEAQLIADVICALLDLAHGPSGMTLEIVPVGVQDGCRVSADDLLKDLHPFDPVYNAVAESWWPTDDPIKTALLCLPDVLASSPHPDQGLPGALLYYRVSTAEYAFLGDSISWARSEEGQLPPRSFFERAKVEQSFHNAFKAVEALLGGEPPRKDRRFRERLAAVGVDPDEKAGYDASAREPIIDVLRRMHATRDKRAAHGGRTAGHARGITYYELMEAQAATAAVLTAAILHLVPAAADPPPP